MNAPVLTFFSNHGGVGKTSLVYHIAWIFSDMGVRILAADLDPQCKLSTAFLDDDRLEELWSEEGSLSGTLYRSISFPKRDVADHDPLLVSISDNLALISGDIALGCLEEELSQMWSKCLDRDDRAFRILSSLWRVIQRGAESHHADLVLADISPNLGAINRAVLIASSHVAVSVGLDLLSFRGLSTLGQTLRDWRQG